MNIHNTIVLNAEYINKNNLIDIVYLLKNNITIKCKKINDFANEEKYEWFPQTNKQKKNITYSNSFGNT